MKIVYFTQSLISCWNHGNAHFLRGLLRELAARGHEVQACEPANSWSRNNLAAEADIDPANRFAKRFPDLDIVSIYDEGSNDPAELVDGADLVIVHEWTDHRVVSAIGRLKLRGAARFVLLFHDTHHRAVSDPNAIRRLELSGYDGVLAFGDSLAQVYRRAGWGDRVFVFHEAADTRLFSPPTERTQREGAVWIGNWGDGERSEELGEFLLRPVQRQHIPLSVYGVRYPGQALTLLRENGATYHGWLPNDEVASVFSRHLFSVHIPRRYYARLLPGIPTIRVFEALACGLPLVCAPWQDSENLFRTGRDFLVASSEREMSDAMRALVDDDGLRRALSASGLETIRQRHTCAHRADELLAIAGELTSQYQGAA